MTGWIKKAFTKRDWRLVAMKVVPYWNVYPDREKDKFEMVYYLSENQFHERRMTVIDACPGRGDLTISELGADDWVFRNREYREVIRPWLDGAYDPEIPSYESIKAKEFKDALKGKKS